tara:strand:- start:15825 stop:16346 length:522 start_codon:yes stop_codon:yes gene_type:complete
MPTDQHGVTHAGALGLFDDVDENNAAAERSERHERECLETVIRREHRRAGRQHRKEAKAARREIRGRSIPSWPASWFGKVLHGGKHSSHDSGSSKLDNGASGDEEKDTVRGRIRLTTEYVVVPRPVTPDPVYTAEDIDPVDSPWLRECGMVRVKSDDNGGCHIVPKSSIQKHD